MSLGPSFIVINARQIFAFRFIFCVSVCIVFAVLLNKNLFNTSNKREIVFIKQLESDCHLTPVDKWHALLNDDSVSTFRIFFRHATAQRNSSYPLISGDTFRALADHIFDETTNVSEWADRVWKIRRGDIVFLQSEKEMLKIFFINTTFSHILHPFVLITHNGDAPVPTKEFSWVLSDSRILTWFAQNPDDDHEKLFPIPTGVANTRWPHGNVSSIKRAIYLHRKPFTLRTTFLYINFDVASNRRVRSKALNWTFRLTNVTRKKSVPFETYLQEIGNAKFVVSPTDNGLDCHRTWEAMLMGAIPIVLRSRLDSLFFNESVVIVDDWNQVTLNYLESLVHQPTPSAKLLARYWHIRLLQAAGRT